jgi:hypothetical protein
VAVDKKSLDERLEEILNEKDARIDQLEAEIEKRDNEAAWSWTRHTMSKAKDPLPTPRLEIRYTLHQNGYNMTATYALVYSHLLGDAVTVPMGFTKISGGGVNRPMSESGQIYGPLRDGAHIRHDMKSLNLPGYLIDFNGEVHRIDLEAEKREREQRNG